MRDIFVNGYAYPSISQEVLADWLPSLTFVSCFSYGFAEAGHIIQLEDDALREIAKEAMERKTGARGLRAIMENATLNLMYEIPSDPTIEKCVITKGVITGDEEPVLTYRDPSEDTDLPKKKVRKKKANTDNGESA